MKTRAIRIPVTDGAHTMDAQVQEFSTGEIRLEMMVAGKSYLLLMRDGTLFLERIG